MIEVRCDRVTLGGAATGGWCESLLFRPKIGTERSCSKCDGEQICAHLDDGSLAPLWICGEAAGAPTHADDVTGIIQNAPRLTLKRTVLVRNTDRPRYAPSVCA